VMIVQSQKYMLPENRENLNTFWTMSFVDVIS